MLSDTTIRAAKPSEKLRKLSDGRGLQLWIMPTGGRLWRMAYRYGGKQKLLALGIYPDVGLKQVRERAEDARRLLAAGVDPSAAKRDEKEQRRAERVNTFAAVAEEWLAKAKREGVTGRARADSTIAALERHVRLAVEGLGDAPIASVRPPDVLAVLRSHEAAGRLETARRLRALYSRIFRYAVATGRADSDPAAALVGAIASPRVQNRAAITSPARVGVLLRAIAGYERAMTRIALQLLAHTFVRPGELRAAEWSEIDFEAAIWTIPKERMKMRKDHIVTLSRQVLELLRKLHEISGGGRYLFPSVRTPARCMSDMTMNAALRRLDFDKDEMCGHGFRAMASTLLNEAGHFRIDAIERALAHSDGSVRGIYNRAELLKERAELMQWWSNYLDTLSR